MRLETFFEKFELFADAPGAVGKMRELVLELAIQGRLISQDSSDEPATNLLERIAAKKLKAGRVVRAKAGRADTVVTNESTTHVPDGWAKASLANLVTVLNGRAYSKDELLSSGTPVLRVGNLFTSNHWYYSDLLLDTDKYCDKGDLIFAWSASFGPFIWPGPKVIYHYHIWKLELHSEADLSKQYLYWFLQNKTQEIKRAGHGVSMLHMTKEKMEKLEVMVPPLAEQKRIVAKVDELMALCDRLEAQQQERDTRYAALARASLARFAEAPTPANLDFLFHPSYPINPADLRKTILTLAVQGKLVHGEADVEIAPLGSILTEASFNGVSKGPTTDKSATEILRISAGTSRQNFFVNEDDFKHVVLSGDEIEKCRLAPGDLLACRFNGNLHFVGRFSLYRGESDRIQVNPDKLIRFRIDSQKHDPRYVCYAMNAAPTRRVIESMCATTAGNIGLSAGRLKTVGLPVPPLPEQRRIVAKVDQLMALVDQLETHLSQAKAKSAALLDAVIHELLNPTAEIVDLAGYRAAIGCYAIKKMQDKRYFGRTAAMKVLYLAQAHVGLELGFQPWRDAAGPLDSWIYRFEDVGQNRDWFKVDEGTTSGGNKKIEYRPGRMLAEQTALAERQLSASQRKELDRLLTLFADKTTEEAEIIATLFAAWNDFLIDGHVPTDDQIITEVRENWHVSKQRFERTLLQTWLGWMRAKGLVPRGREPHTVHQSRLPLS